MTNKGKLLVGLLATTCLVACSQESSSSIPQSSKEDTSSSAEVIDPNIKDPASIDNAFNSLYDAATISDPTNGFVDSSSVLKMKAQINGSYVGSFSSVTSRQDAKIELYTSSAMRFINASGGYIFTLPTVDVDINGELGKYRTQFTFGDSILSVSAEASNPYTSDKYPWYTYGSEWLMGHIMDADYMSKNNLSRITPLTYNFTSDHPYGDTTFKPGYDVYFFGIKVNDPGVMERPFYNIAVVREVTDVKNFTLFVMKSKADQTQLMEYIITSYKKVTSKGIQRNYFYSDKPTFEPHWNAETKNYYQSLLDNEYCNWGVFSYSMPGGSSELAPGNYTYDTFLSDAIDVQTRIETRWNHKYEIYPTYTHIGFGGIYHYFPTQQAKELAGGNGINGKPVLQFTYQFTIDNNNVGNQANPGFDILRGVYDDHFKKLAQDMKEYGKPILFRLNNEMNTDWTSYSGIMSLLDPDFFQMTWKRLYDICIAEGCNNLIWIWNPIAITCPYSSWGEDMCYFPGVDYVQLLGGTSYEYNNYSEKECAAKVRHFSTLYGSLFKKNNTSFSTNWKMILSEFACGSGGETTGLLGRNSAVQAEWVKRMFEEFNSPSPAEYIKQIRGAVWFNANDYSGRKISNRLQLLARPGNTKENYDDMEGTMNAFAKGFADQDARLAAK